jgi:hypothetical protein
MGLTCALAGRRTAAIPAKNKKPGRRLTAAQQRFLRRARLVCSLVQSIKILSYQEKLGSVMLKYTQNFKRRSVSDGYAYQQAIFSSKYSIQFARLTVNFFQIDFAV